DAGYAQLEADRADIVGLLLFRSGLVTSAGRGAHREHGDRQKRRFPAGDSDHFDFLLKIFFRFAGPAIAGGAPPPIKVRANQAAPASERLWPIGVELSAPASLRFLEA